MTRCCDSHDDWTTLAEHLVKEFPELGTGDVVRELTNAKSAAADFGVDGPELFEVAELMTRHQLRLLTGDIADVARLDPERHVRRTAGA